MWQFGWGKILVNELIFIYQLDGKILANELHVQLKLILRRSNC